MQRGVECHMWGLKKKCKCGREIYCKKTGECNLCYQKRLYGERSQEQIDEINRKRRKRDNYRYANDLEYRTKKLQEGRRRMKIYIAKKELKEPGWNARKQRKWRKKYPKNFNRTMAKCYLRHLEPVEIKEILKEIKKEKNRI